MPEAFMDELKNFSHLVKFPVEEACFGQFIVHLGAQLHDTLCVSIR